MRCTNPAPFADKAPAPSTHSTPSNTTELPAASDARFVDPETDAELQISVADVRSEYRAAVADALAEWERSLRPHGIDYEVIDTSLPLSRGLRAYLRKRERLG